MLSRNIRILDQENDDGRTLLHIAALHGNHNKLRDYLNSSKFGCTIQDIMRRDNYGHRPIDLCSIKGYNNKLEQLASISGIDNEQDYANIKNEDAAKTVGRLITGFVIPIKTAHYFISKLSLISYSAHCFELIRTRYIELMRGDKKGLNILAPKFTIKHVNNPLHWAIYKGDPYLSYIAFLENPMLIFLRNEEGYCPLDMVLINQDKQKFALFNKRVG